MLPFDFKNLTKEILQSYCDIYINTRKQIITEIINDKLNTYESTFKKLSDFENEYTKYIKVMNLVTNIYEDKELIRVAQQMSMKITNNNEYNEELAKKLNLVYDNLNITNINDEDKQFMNNMMKHLKYNNDEIKQIILELHKLEIEYENNIRTYSYKLNFTKSELDGMPLDWFTYDKAIKRNLLYTNIICPVINVTMNSIFPITNMLDYRIFTYYTIPEQTYIFDITHANYSIAMNYIHSEKIRKKIYQEYNNRCYVNKEILTKILLLRQKLAIKMGAKTYADFRLKSRIIKSSDNAINFLMDLNAKIDNKYKKDLNELTNFAKTFNKNPIVKEKLDMWDIDYYTYFFYIKSINYQQSYDIFNFNDAIYCVINTFSKILGLEFKFINTTNKWHNDVDLYEVYDIDTKILLGYIYLDLYSRKNKQNNGFILDVNSSYIDNNGNQTPSLCVISCSYNKDFIPSSTKTFFHEFGHAMHHICCRTKLINHDFNNVERDFIEVPSMLFELMYFNKDMYTYINKDNKSLIYSIKMLNKHFNFMISLRIKQEIFYGLFEIYINNHNFDSNTQIPYESIIKYIKNKISFNMNISDAFYCSDEFNMQTIMKYTYLLSAQYASHIYCTQFENNLINKQNGMRLRKILFEQGATKSAEELFKELIGEELNTSHYYKLKEIT